LPLEAKTPTLQEPFFERLLRRCSHLF